MMITERHRPSHSLRDQSHESALRILAESLLGVVLDLSGLLGGLGFGDIRLGFGLVERIPGLVHQVRGLVGSLVFDIAGRIGNFAAGLFGNCIL